MLHINNIKNSYIHTCNISKDPFHRPVLDISKSALISLIAAITGKDFGSMSVLKFGRKAISFLEINELDNDSVIKMLDSGGYSIIAGDISYADISRFIEVYHYGIETLHKNFDIVFSLDIPIFLATPSVNTKEIIENLNRISIQHSIDSIKKDPELKESWTFILQWKLKGQFEIWDKLYDELEVYKYHKHYGIGGMVGLTKLANLKFAPFIGPVFWAIDKHIKHHTYNGTTEPFLIHLLGIYNPVYRFIIYFLEELLKRKYPNFQSKITYDTINWAKTAMFKCKSGMDVMYYDEKSNNINIYDSKTLTDPQIEEIFGEALVDYYKDQIKHVAIDGNKLESSTLLIPVNIFSNIQFDNFMKDFISNHNLIAIIDDPKTKWNAKLYQLTKIIVPGLLYTKYFSKMQIDYILESIRLVYIGSNVPVKKFMPQFIDKVNVPFDLG